MIRGVDLSYTPQIEDAGGIFKVNGAPADVVRIFKENGANWVRLRLWYNPAGGYCGLAKTIAMAKRVKAAGLKFLLDFHYSDSWADPGKQTKPSAWSSLSFNQLKDSLYAYTKRVITTLISRDVKPDMVQLGNEITAGFLWPEGQVSGSNNWGNFVLLLNKAAAGVNDAKGSDTIKIMLHIDRGGSYSGASWWLDRLNAAQTAFQAPVNFDVLGVSYYPWWHGPIDSLKDNLNKIAANFGKAVNVVETAYPWTLAWNDNTLNQIGLTSQLLPEYPATPQGQHDFLISLINIVKDVPEARGTGFFYWAPDCITAPLLGSSGENLTFFDFKGEVLSSISVFNSSNSSKVQTNSLPSSYHLYQNYPNPFNGNTKIKFNLPVPAFTKLEVYNVLGEKIAILINRELSAGNHEASFNANNLPGGIYFCRLQAGDFVLSRKMDLLK